MPRRSRLILPSVPLHVIQRGHDRQLCFLCDDDFQRYRELLHEWVALSAVQIHAYVLMSNHVHLLLSAEDRTALAKLMKSVAQRYSEYFNLRYRRSGSVWDGRYKSCPVQSEKYLLVCQRYIELNPVRARMVRFPGNYRWSSYRGNAEGRRDNLITPHPVFLRLGREAGERRQAYCSLFRESLPQPVIEQIRQFRPLGDAGFLAQIGQQPR